jgi:hypothetical protein
MLFGACLGFCVDINEADPKFANDLVFGNPDESAWDVAVGGTLAAREVMLHEWGHLIGLDHESGFNTMIAAGLKPRIGGTGSHSVPSGDDRKGAASLYGGPASFRNLGASATRFTGGAVTATTFAGTVFVTPGVTIVNMNFTLVNHGTGQLTFNWREHVNGCPDCTTGGTTWASWTGAVVNNRNQVFVPHSLPAPASLPCAFTFWTFHTVDTGGAHAESREFDNVTHHATTLRWQCF